MPHLSRMLLTSFLFSTLFYSTPETSSADAGKIEVTAHGFRNDNGAAVVLLFNVAEGFPKKEKAFKVLNVKISNRVVHTEFDGLPTGTYAIAVFDDENANGKLDTNFFGIPKEGVGASNGAKGQFGPPKFNDAVFRLDTTTVHIDITIAYL